jgi:N-acetylmuramoyl-L-alanine amidase
VGHYYGAPGVTAASGKAELDPPRLGASCASAIGERLRAAGLAPSRYHADADLGEDRPYADKRNGVHFFDNLAVARTATMPAVLVEAGVIVNRYEERELRKPRIRRRVAEAIAQGVVNCLP